MYVCICICICIIWTYVHIMYTYVFSDHEILSDIYELSNIRGLTNYENRLYWTEGVDDAIRWVDKYPPYETGILIKNRINIGDISIFHRNREEPCELYIRHLIIHIHCKCTP